VELTRRWVARGITANALDAGRDLHRVAEALGP
jgi:hypothetical protein